MTTTESYWTAWSGNKETSIQNHNSSLESNPWVQHPIMRSFHLFQKRTGPWTLSAPWLSDGRDGRCGYDVLQCQGADEHCQCEVVLEGNIKMFPISISSQEIRLLLQLLIVGESHQLWFRKWHEERVRQYFRNFFCWPLLTRSWNGSRSEYPQIARTIETLSFHELCSWENFASLWNGWCPPLHFDGCRWKWHFQSQFRGCEERYWELLKRLNLFKLVLERRNERSWLERSNSRKNVCLLPSSFFFCVSHFLLDL